MGGQIRLWFDSLLHIVMTLTVIHQKVQPDVIHYVREPDEAVLVSGRTAHCYHLSVFIWGHWINIGIGKGRVKRKL